MKTEGIKVKITVEKWFTEANNVFAEMLSERVGVSITEKEAIQMAEEFALTMIKHAIKVEKQFDPYYQGGKVDVARLLMKEIKLAERKHGVF